MRIRKAASVGFALCALSLVLCGGAQAAGGTVSAWGGNSYGQIGNGTVASSGCYCGLTPATVKGLGDVVQVAAGEDHALALRADGTVFSWGANAHAELGNGTSGAPVATAAPVPGLTNVIAVAASGEQSIALRADGTVAAWGEAFYGQLGVDGSTGPEDCSISTCSRKPITVPGLSGVVAIAAGDHFNLALLADGTVMGWGYAYYGGLGTRQVDDKGCFCIPHPIRVPGVSGAVAIAAGGNTAAALLRDGTLVTWGGTSSGQLGNGTVYTNSPPAPECFCLAPGAVPGLSGLSSIAVSDQHMLAGRQSGGVSAWGGNENGQLGTGAASPTGECHCIPTPVATTVVAGVTEVSAGRFSLAREANGSVWVWGGGNSGQRGDGSLIPVNPSPAAVPGLTGASAVNAGSFTAYALIGPSHTLQVALAGAGSGTVGTNGIVCPGDCLAPISDSQTKVLRADSTAGGFAGFSGPCTGTGPCQVRMGSDQTVTATFGPPAGTAITQALVKSRQKKATFSFTAPGAITGYECKLVKPKAKKKGHGKKHSKGKASASGKKGAKKGKGKKPQFSACATPATYKHLQPGAYSFEVRALDILGADAVPAVKKFTIKKVKKKHHPKRKHSQQH